MSADSAPLRQRRSLRRDEQPRHALSHTLAHARVLYRWRAQPRRRCSASRGTSSWFPAPARWVLPRRAKRNGDTEMLSLRSRSSLATRLAPPQVSDTKCPENASAAWLIAGHAKLRITHPDPNERFYAKHPRQEAYGVILYPLNEIICGLADLFCTICHRFTHYYMRQDLFQFQVDCNLVSRLQWLTSSRMIA